MTEKVLFAWSGGKDSAMALYEVLKNRKYNVAALLTTVTQDYDRVSMHGVRRVLLEQQAALLGHPLETVLISKRSSNEEYEAKMKEKLICYKKKGITAVVFGDIFLEDLKKYREDNLAKLALQGVFPIWKRDTHELAAAFIDLSFRAIITCVDSKFLDKSFAGRVFDKQFLLDLPGGVDPCGENGEFHSFVYDGPIFSRGITFEKGQVVLRDNRFYYCDLVEAEDLKTVSV
jgi:uncharacterized protein (TIGR00290 family)